MDPFRPELRFKPDVRLKGLQADHQGETTAQTWRADHPDRPLHQACQTLANGQAQAGAGNGVGAGSRLVERIEEKDLVLRVDATTTVRDLPVHTQPLTINLPCTYPQHHLATVGEFHGIAEQVVQHLTDTCRVTVKYLRDLRIDKGVEV
ncbi:hypothetical protein D3C72_2011140 [compost metagenome]